LKRTKTGEDIHNALEPSDFITAVLVDLSTNDELSPDDPTPYRVHMFLAFTPGDDPEAVQAQADAVAEQIETAFEKRCFNKKRRDREKQKLHLVSCI
jgi:hypothetical protein